MVAVLREEFLFRFRKYWALTFEGWWWWLFVYGGVLFTDGQSRGPLLSLIPIYIFWGIYIFLLGYIGDLGLYLPNQLNKTMFFVPMSAEDRKKYICVVLWTKIAVIGVFFGMSSLIFAIMGWLPEKWIVCMYITGILWGIVVIFGDIQLRQNAVEKKIEIKKEFYQNVNIVIYVFYLCLFFEKSLNRTVFPLWWFQLLVWIAQLVLVVYTVRVKMPLVLCGHDYETVHRRDDT